MHRNQLLEDLKGYKEKYPEETLTIHRFERFVSDNPDCFKRSLEQGHVTGSAWLLSLDKKSTLLTLHKKLDKWLQLGGHADGQSNVLKVALKEAREESGIDFIEPMSNEIFDIDIHLIPGNPKEKAHLHYDVRYLLKVRLTESFEVSSESQELAWVPLKKLTEYSKEESLLRMSKKSEQILNYSL